MSENGSAALRIQVLCMYQEMGESFVNALDPKSSGGAGRVQVGSAEVELSVLAGDPRVNAAWEDQIRNAQGLVLLVRFMDVISMDKVRAIFRSIPSDSPAGPDRCGAALLFILSALSALSAATTPS